MAVLRTRGAAMVVAVPRLCPLQVEQVALHDRAHRRRCLRLNVVGNDGLAELHAKQVQLPQKRLSLDPIGIIACGWLGWGS